MTVATYTPKEVSLLIGGSLVTGWDRITVQRNAESFRQVRGIRGKNTRVRNRDSSATMTVELAQTSITNSIFSQILQLDLAQGTGRLEWTLRDAKGEYVFQTNTGYVSSYPESGFSGEIETRRWTLLCDSSTIFVGGNPQEGVDLFEMAKDAAKQAQDRLNGFIDNVTNQG